MEIPLITESSCNGYTIRAIVADPQWKENCYLVTCEATGAQALIDPGDNAPLLASLVEECGSRRLEYLLLTHGHFDHIGAAVALCKQFAVECMIHEADHRLLRQASMYAIRYSNRLVAAPRSCVTLSGERHLPFGTGSITVLHTPGHTAGSVCYVCDGFVFTGDTLLVNYAGRTDQPGGDESTIVASIGKLLETLPEETVIFPGHGKTWTVAAARSWWREHGAEPPKHDSFIH